MKRLGGGLARAFLVAVLVVGAAAARAGIDPAEWQARAEDPRSFEAVKAHFAPALEVVDYPTVFRALQAEAEAVPWAPESPVHGKLLWALRLLNNRFAYFNRHLDGARDEGAALDRFLSDFPTGLFQRQNEAFFSGRAFEVAYGEVEALPEEQAADFLYRTDTIHKLLWELKKPALRVTVQGIRHARERWDTFLDQRMSQYPWEAIANGALGDQGTIQFPPERQWIMLHPELGVEVSAGGARDLRVKESLLVELLGHIWYRWNQREDPGAGLRWWGLSAALSLRDDLRPGVGLVGHYGKLVTLGVLWHDRDEDGAWFDQAPFVVFGLDLFRLVEDTAPETAGRWQQALRARDATVARP